MRETPKTPLRKSLKRKPKPVLAPSDAPFDAKRSARSTRAANQAADRLLREMDAFLEHTGGTHVGRKS